jgi:hypothetical protein
MLIEYILIIFLGLFIFLSGETSFQTNGIKKNHLLQIRLDFKQKERLEALASASGFKSVSDYVRTNLLNPSIEHKLNTILSLLQENKKRKKVRDKNGNFSSEKI